MKLIKHLYDETKANSTPPTFRQLVEETIDQLVGGLLASVSSLLYLYLFSCLIVSMAIKFCAFLFVYVLLSFLAL